MLGLGRITFLILIEYHEDGGYKLWNKLKITVKYKDFNDINEVPVDFIEVVLNQIQEAVGFSIKTVVTIEEIILDIQSI
ncbi:hypothetical protein B5M42_013810 [Paenibacillus athensensis]|uniref:Uncharacterized protein n=1 Tax=Paenibacillus athensensis TaxID=1967502 RepID=A0A4Y8PZX8_9BACL|nr:hypothetical protein [Paenibacillus athensensis]MCD1259908.1 hypothetical protein [Paenibacillus athensensis]